MKYLALIDEEGIYFSDWKSAIQGAKEMGFEFFFPRKSVFSTEDQKEIVVKVDGMWKQIPLKSDGQYLGECTCGCNL